MEEETIIPFTGIILDKRTDLEKESDIHFSEVVSTAAPVNWIEKPSELIRKFPIFNQGQSGSCVAQSGAKLDGINYWLSNGQDEYVHFSATHIYQRRINKPTGGMSGDDVFNIMSDGVTLEELVPSQNMSDAEMDSVKIPQYKIDVGKIFKTGKKLHLPDGDIESVASVIQTTGKGVMVWFYWTADEWTVVPVIKNPSLNLYANTTARHSVVAVDFTILGPSNVPNNPDVWGKKALVIDDSWGSRYGAAGQRYITEDFFKARNFFAAYTQRFTFDLTDSTEPSSNLNYVFNKDLSFIPWDSVNNKPKDEALNAAQLQDVIHLQNILKAEGVFAKNVDSTGYYGSVTAEAVLLFQKKYNVASLQELETLKGKRVGPGTRLVLNTKY